MALSTIGTAGIADDAITSAKVDSTTTAFTVADLVATNSITAGTELIGNISGRILLDASAAGTDVGDEFLLNATDGSASNDGGKILFEEGTYGQNLTEGVGSVLQVQQGFTTAQLSSASTTYVTTGLIVKITPKFSNSKILLFCNLNLEIREQVSYGSARFSRIRFLKPPLGCRAHPLRLSGHLQSNCNISTTFSCCRQCSEV